LFSDHLLLWMQMNRRRWCAVGFDHQGVFDAESSPPINAQALRIDRLVQILLMRPCTAQCLT